MSTKKVTTAGSSQYWWGYTTQVNFVNIGTNHIEQFLITRGSDIINTSGFLGFFCNYNQAVSTAIVNTVTRDCLTREIMAADANPAEAATERSNCSAVPPQS